MTIFEARDRIVAARSGGTPLTEQDKGVLAKLLQTRPEGWLRLLCRQVGIRTQSRDWRTLVDLLLGVEQTRS